MQLTVRRIRSGEGAALKSVRLAALLDTPAVFASTHEREVAFTDEEWAGRAAAGAQGDERATFVAELDGQVVGLVGAYTDGATPGAVELVSMWTLPATRRTGTGRLLVRAVLDWAGAAGAQTVGLWVIRGNEPAQRLYEAMGFTETGDFQPLPSDPCKDELRMSRAQ